MNRKIALLASLAMTLNACERINIDRSITVDPKPEKAHAIFVDAKQRAVTVVPSTTTSVMTAISSDGKTQTVTTSTTPLRVCAEPSPDALTAIATAAQGNLSVQDKLALGASLGRTESAASIGLRTQSIQLMRDVLFRICEDYQSGSLTPAGVETLTRRYQSSMVAILAIEQLTGVVRAPAVVLGGTASTGGAEAVAKIYGAQVDAQTGAKAATAKAAAAKAAHTEAVAAQKALVDAGESDADKLKAAKDKVDAAKAAMDSAVSQSAAADADLETANKAMAAVAPGNVLSASNGAFQKAEPLGGEQTASLANAVVQIVQDTLQLGFLRESCATLMVASIEGRSKLHPGGDTEVGNFADSCKAYFDATVQQQTVANEKDAAIVGLVSRVRGDAKDLDALARVLEALNGGSAAGPARSQPAQRAPAGMAPY